ncbi:MAG: hypothetical protein V1743_06485 [Nanoarchaeota archaeon]
MHKLYSIIGITAIIAASTVGCGKGSEMRNVVNTAHPYQREEALETIVGQPQSVQLVITDEYGKGLSAMLKTPEGENVLCHSYVVFSRSSSALDFVDTAAAIQSEINDGDDEQVQFKGKNVDGIFELLSGKANDYNFKLENDNVK